MKNHWLEQRKLKIPVTIELSLYDRATKMLQCPVTIKTYKTLYYAEFVSDNKDFVTYAKLLEPLLLALPLGTTNYHLDRTAFVEVRRGDSLLEAHKLKDVYVNAISFFMSGWHATNNLKMNSSIVMFSVDIPYTSSQYFKF
jgi:hypothetical protein